MNEIKKVKKKKGQCEWGCTDEGEGEEMQIGMGRKGGGGGGGRKKRKKIQGGGWCHNGRTESALGTVCLAFLVLCPVCRRWLQNEKKDFFVYAP